MKSPYEAAYEAASRALESPAGKQLRKALTQTLETRHSPGRSITLGKPGTTRAWLRISRRKKGTLLSELQGTGREHPIYLHPAHTWSTGENHPVWNSVFRAAREERRALLEKWLRTSFPQLTAPFRRTLAPQLENQTRPSEKNIQRELETALQSIPDPEVLQTALQYTRGVTIHRYNIALMGRELLQTALRESPGSCTWAMETPGAGPIPRSREQMDRQFRRYLAERGVAPGQARTAARLRQGYMRRLLRIDRDYGIMPELINAVCDALEAIRQGSVSVQAVQAASETLAEHSNRDLKKNLISNNQAADELLHLMDAQTHREAARYLSPVRPQSFMIALMGEDNLRTMRKNSPGLITWAMFHAGAEFPINHPGQLTTIVRKQTMENLLEAGCWPTFAKLPMPLMKVLASGHHAPSTSLVLVNAIAQFKCTPTLKTAQRAAAKFTLRHRGPGNRQNARQDARQDALDASAQNMKRAAGLLFRESERRALNNPDDWRQFELARQTPLILDYIWNMPAGEETPARTWNGLVRRSSEWHEQIVRRDQAARLDRDGNAQWNCIISSPRMSEDLTVRHLGSSRELLEESGRMHHCISTYAGLCRQGNHRIFTVERDGETIATGQITLIQGLWVTEQVQGPCNAEPHPDALQAMMETARAYTQAWTGPEQHRWWQE